MFGELFVYRNKIDGRCLKFIVCFLLNATKLTQVIEIRSGQTEKQNKFEYDNRNQIYLYAYEK